MDNPMKSFSELISWELEQEQKHPKKALGADESDHSLNDSVNRQLRYLSSAQRKSESLAERAVDSQT